MRTLTLVTVLVFALCGLNGSADAQSWPDQAIIVNNDGSTVSQGANIIVGNFPTAGQYQQFFWSPTTQRWQFSNTLQVNGTLRANNVITSQSADANVTNCFLQFGGTNSKNILWNAGLARFQFSGNTETVGTHTVKVLEITGGSDLAEDFAISTDKEIEPGTVLVIDPQKAGELKVSEKAYDRTVAGIVSGAGGLSVGMRMGQKGTAASGDHPVALTGRVYCKTDATMAAITPGDMLTTSNKAGFAMKVLDSSMATGAILGKAMTSLAQGETGLVLVLVSLQ